MPEPSTAAQVDTFVAANGHLLDPVWLDDGGWRTERAAATMAQLQKRVIGAGVTTIRVDVGDLPALAERLPIAELVDG